MSDSRLSSLNLIARLGLGFLFIYHGLVPKIIWLNVTEIQLVELSGVGIPASIASPIAGVLEVGLGLLIICFRNMLWPVYLAALSLVFLLLYCGLIMPSVLIEAFNPVSTNMMGLVLCYMVIKSQVSHVPSTK